MSAATAPRAAIYARFSTDKQTEASIEDQTRVCNRLADRQGFRVVATFSDAAISGGTARRPGYQKLLQAARRKEFAAILAEDLKRLWREQAEQWRALKELQDLGIHIITDSGIDSRQQNFEVIASVMGAAGELDRKEAAYRTRRGLEGRARKQLSVGGRAYGYTPAKNNESKRIETNDEEAAVVRQIYKWRAEGHSARVIAKRLNAPGVVIDVKTYPAGVPAPGANWKRTGEGKHRKTKDKGWRTSAIAGNPERGTGILNNPIYRGRIVWGRSKWTRSAADSSIRKWAMVADQSQWIVYEEPRLQIVRPALWDQVQVIQTSRSARRNNIREGVRKYRAARGRGPAHFLSTIGVCGVCDSNFIGYGERDYLCPTYGVGKCTNNLRFRRDTFHTDVFEITKRVFTDPVALEYAESQFKKELAKLAAEDDTAASNNAEVGRLNDQIDHLRAEAKAGKLTGSVAQVAIAQAEQERDAARNRHSARRNGQLHKALSEVDALPDLMRGYVEEVQQGARSVSQPQRVHVARERMREWLVDGRIVLTPSADRTALCGTVRLRGLPTQVLNLPGVNKVVAGVIFGSSHAG